MKTNRAILSVEQEKLFGLLRDVRKLGRSAQLDPKAVPVTAKLVAVHYNPARQGFDFILEDESFPPTSPGCQLPYIEAAWIS